MAEPLTNEQRRLSDPSRGTDRRNTENTMTSNRQILQQEEPYASRAGPLMKMIAAVERAKKIQAANKREAIMDSQEQDLLQRADRLEQELRFRLPLGLQQELLIRADRLQQELQARLPRRSVNTLLLFSKGLEKTTVRLFNEAHFKSQAETQIVDSWNDILSSLAEFQSINKLVLLVHSSQVGMLLFRPDATGHAFQEGKRLRDAATELSALEVKPKIRTVDMEGCNVTQDLEGVLKFGIGLGAKEIIAMNHFHELAQLRLQVEKGQDKVLESEIRRLNGYITSPGLQALIEQAKTKPVHRNVLLEWFVATPILDSQNLPIGPGDTARREKDFHTRGSIRSRTITNKSEFDRIKESFEPSGTRQAGELTSPVRVIIKLGAFPRSKKQTPTSAQSNLTIDSGSSLSELSDLLI
jgi:hypothetical protein